NADKIPLGRAKAEKILFKLAQVEVKESIINDPTAQLFLGNVWSATMDQSSLVANSTPFMVELSKLNNGTVAIITDKDTGFEMTVARTPGASPVTFSIKIKDNNGLRFELDQGKDGKKARMYENTIMSEPSFCHAYSV